MAGLVRGRRLLTLVLLAAVVWSLLTVEWNRDMVHPGGASSVAELFGSLFRPELSPSFLRIALEASWKTVSFAVAGLTVAVAVGLPLGVLASGVLTPADRLRWANVVVVRLVLAVLRAIHELVWAWLFIVAFGLSSMTAVLALGIPYAGILGRIYSEILNDQPEAPLRALRSSGASEMKVLLYGRLPMALPDILSYTFYRFECGIRSAAIMSFVGIQGLGYQVQLSLADLLYDEVWTLLLFMITLVVLVDLWSSLVRRRMAS